MSANRINWGILGTSEISHKMAKAIQSSTSGHLAAIASRTASTAQAFASQYAIPTFYADYNELLADINIDVVYIGLPNHLHKEWMIRAAQAGKHILCEKPLVTNLQDAQDALSAVKKANVFCMEALMYRCHPVIPKLCELMRQKAIGHVRLFNAVYTANIAAAANPIAGDCILNLGCYPISLIRLLAGVAHGRQTAEPSNVVSIGELDLKERHIATASVLLHFPKQMQATVSVADDIEMSAQFDIYGTDGYIKLLTNPWMPGATSRILVKRHDQAEPTEIIVSADKNVYTYQIDFVSAQILAGSTNAEVGGVSWLDSLGNTIVLEAWRNQVQAKLNPVAVPAND